MRYAPLPHRACPPTRRRISLRSLRSSPFKSTQAPRGGYSALLTAFDMKSFEIQAVSSTTRHGSPVMTSVPFSMVAYYTSTDTGNPFDLSSGPSGVALMIFLIVAGSVGITVAMLDIMGYFSRRRMASAGGGYNPSPIQPCEHRPEICDLHFCSEYPVKDFLWSGISW